MQDSRVAAPLTGMPPNADAWGKSGLGYLARRWNTQSNDLACNLAGMLRCDGLGGEQNATVVLQLLNRLQDVGQSTVTTMLLGRLGEGRAVPTLR